MQERERKLSILSVDPETGLPQDLGRVYTLGLQGQDFHDKSMQSMLRDYVPGAVRRMVSVREYFEKSLLPYAHSRQDVPDVTLDDLMTPKNERRIACLDRIRELLREVVDVPTEEINLSDVRILVGWAVQIIYNPEIAGVYARSYRTKPSDIKRLLRRLRGPSRPPVHQEVKEAA